MSRVTRTGSRSHAYAEDLRSIAARSSTTGGISTMWMILGFHELAHELDI